MGIRGFSFSYDGCVMKLIVGLGNPGPEYARTRHNAGFMVIDRLAARHGLTSDRSRFHGLVLDGVICGERCILLKPMTYMNRSGLSVREARAFYKIDLADVLIVVDDIALPLGTIRLRPSGGAGGHNGLADIEKNLGTKNYVRLRIGIDPPGRIPQVDYVLGRFTEEQLEKLEPAIERACDAIESWLTVGLEKTMSLFNAG